MFRSCIYKRQDFFHLKIVGNLLLKMAVLESMITDLFISITLLRISFNQKHFRLFSSFEDVTTNLINLSFHSSAHKLSRVNTTMERVLFNFIYYVNYYLQFRKCMTY